MTTSRFELGDGILEPLHEGVVADPVLDHEPRLRDGEAVARARLEEMRVGVRVGEDRRDGDVRAADLLRHVAVDVLGRDDAERRAACSGRSAGGRGAEEENRETGENDSQSHRRLE